MSVNYKKWISLSGISVSLLMILTQFQNCAPAVSDLPSSSAAGTDPQVRVIDDWATTKVQISNKILQTSPEDSGIAVQGFCDRHIGNSEPMSWSVREPAEPDAILTGAVSCQRGGFSLQITQLSQLVCGTAYSFEIRTLDGDVDQAVLIRNCSL